MIPQIFNFAISLENQSPASSSTMRFLRPMLYFLRPYLPFTFFFFSFITSFSFNFHHDTFLTIAELVVTFFFTQLLLWRSLFVRYRLLIKENFISFWIIAYPSLVCHCLLGRSSSLGQLVATVVIRWDFSFQDVAMLSFWSQYQMQPSQIKMQNLKRFC